MPNNRDFLANRASNVHPEAAQLRIQLEEIQARERASELSSSNTFSDEASSFYVHAVTAFIGCHDFVV